MAESQAQRLDQLGPDTLFKHYRLLEQIGLGGQGVVWSALDPTHERLVAIKFSEPLEDQNTARLAEFEKQARLFIPLDHPNILPIFDFGRSGTLRYLVSPYVAGGSLRELLDASALSYAEILSITGEIVSALAYLHARNIVHRDLKPSNIFLDFDRRAYLADFGLAREISDTTVALHTGRGTLPYAPPEQHSLAGLTAQSDIYSLGVMLFEMFTRHLPWHGEKTLGIQQLHTDDALPDPIVSAPDAPRELAAVLRTLTAADPAHRPRSIVEAFDQVRALFSPAPPAGPPALDAAGSRWGTAGTLLERGLEEWTLSSERFPLSFTKFVLADLECGRDSTQGWSEAQGRFMLAGALTFDYRLDHWWTRVAAARDRIQVCGQLIEKGNLVIIHRVVDQLYAEASLPGGAATLPPSAAKTLVGFAAQAGDLSDRVLRVLRALTAPAREWQAVRFGPEEDQTLAALALSDGPQALEAARLIGHARSASGVSTIMEKADDAHLLPALVAIQQSAGSLPPSVPASVRLQVRGEALFRQLTAEPRTLVGALGATAAGGLLGFGAHVYITYRLPAFMDATRILIAIERGLFLGVLVGFGLFLARLIVQRWLHQRLATRLVLAALLGGLVINSSWFLHSILFLDLLPEGGLIPLGSVLVALGFGLSGAARQRATAVAVACLAIGTGLGVTWVLHLATGMHPLLFYEYASPPAQTALIMLLTALPVGIGGAWVHTGLSAGADPGSR